MIYLFGILVLLFFLLLIYRKLNNKYQENKFRYRYHKLRDDLRRLAIDGKVASGSDEFDYLDFSISKSIQKSYLLTLFYLFALTIKHAKFKSDLEHYKKTYDELLEKIKSNDHLRIINERRNKILSDYIIGQNKITFFIVKNILSIIIGINKFKMVIKDKIAYSNYLPEISGIS